MTNDNKGSAPVLVIDICSTSSDDQKQVRSLSLLNACEAYKDLSGITHRSSSSRSKHFFIRSYSCPNHSPFNEKSIRLRSSSTTIDLGMKLLDPFLGLQSPDGSSSQYSLYGSYFHLSENDFHSSSRVLAIDGHPLLIFNPPSKFSLTTYQDKCNRWLRHLH